MLLISATSEGGPKYPNVVDYIEDCLYLLKGLQNCFLSSSHIWVLHSFHHLTRQTPLRSTVHWSYGTLMSSVTDEFYKSSVSNRASNRFISSSSWNFVTKIWWWSYLRQSPFLGAVWRRNFWFFPFVLCLGMDSFPCRVTKCQSLVVFTSLFKIYLKLSRHMHVLSFSPSCITLFKEKTTQIRSTKEWNKGYSTNPGNLVIKWSRTQTRRTKDSLPQG